MKKDDIERLYNLNLCKEIVLPMPSVRPPKYKFSRAHWYTADLSSNFVWRFSSEYNEIIDWCTKHFGSHPEKADAWSRWWVGPGTIYFRDEQDYIMYRLRWA